MVSSFSFNLRKKLLPYCFRAGKKENRLAVWILYKLPPTFMYQLKTWRPNIAVEHSRTLTFDGFIKMYHVKNVKSTGIKELVYFTIMGTGKCKQLVDLWINRLCGLKFNQIKRWRRGQICLVPTTWSVNSVPVCEQCPRRCLLYTSDSGCCSIHVYCRCVDDKLLNVDCAYNRFISRGYWMQSDNSYRSQWYSDLAFTSKVTLQ